MLTWLKNKSNKLVSSTKNCFRLLTRKICLKSPYLFNKVMSKTITDLKRIQNNYENFVFTDEDAISLQSIVENRAVTLYDYNKDFDVRKLSTYIETPQRAVKLASGDPVSTHTLSLLKGININDQDEKYFIYWFSNDSDVKAFVAKMQEHLTVQRCQIMGSEIPDHLNNNRNLVFIETRLYQYLLADLVSLLLFYAELTYDRETKKYSLWKSQSFYSSSGFK